MNTLQFLKNGSGIHIKKENRGKFTDYCGGKVTSECIAKGKKSSNPTIRKRATFADNARHFKHRLGGRVKKHQAFVNGISILDSNPDAYKFVKRKLKKAAEGDNTQNWFQKNSETINTIGKTVAENLPTIVSSIKNSKAARQQGKANEIADDVSEAEMFAENYKNEYEALQKGPQFINGVIVNRGSIDLKHEAYQRAWEKTRAAMAKKRAETKTKNAQLYAQANSDTASAIMGSIGNIANTTLGFLSQKSNNNTNNGSSDKDKILPDTQQTKGASPIYDDNQTYYG